MRLIAMTALHDDTGDFQAIYNGQRDKVVEAVKAEMAAQQAQARTIEDSRNRLLAEKLEADRAAISAKRGCMKRAARRVGDAWALVMGTALVWGEALGLWTWETMDKQDGV